MSAEAFRGLFKSPNKEQPQQTTAKRPGSRHNTAAARNRTPSNSPFNRSGKSGQSNRKTSKASVASQQSLKSAKSSGSRKKSGPRNAPSTIRSHQKSLQKSSQAQHDHAQDTSNQRTPSKSPTPVTTPTSGCTTPPTSEKRRDGTVLRTPKDKQSTTTVLLNGQEVQEKSVVCKTIFENDDGAAAGGAAVQVAETRIKERKLQWKKETPIKDMEKDPAKKEHQSPKKDKEKGSPNKLPCLPEETEKKEKFGDVKLGPGGIPEAANNKTITIFENDDQHPAEVKEEKCKLQWAPGVTPTGHECPSDQKTPKKKHTTMTTMTVATVEASPDKGYGRSKSKTPVQGSPPPRTPAARSATQDGYTTTNPTSVTGEVESAVAPVELVSMYLAPTLQQGGELNSAEMLKKDPGEQKQ